MDKWFPIETPRLLLREFRADDEDAIHEYASDSEVCRFTDWGPNTREETHRFSSERLAAQRHWPRSQVDLALELRAEHRMIGAISLWLTGRGTTSAEFGYALNRSYWGNGYVTEAAAAVLERAVPILGIRRVVATCDVRNVRSARVMERLGLQRERTMPSDRMQRGQWRDSFLYSRTYGGAPEASA